jgi:hypothetical protein
VGFLLGTQQGWEQSPELGSHAGIVPQNLPQPLPPSSSRAGPGRRESCLSPLIPDMGSSVWGRPFFFKMSSENKHSCRLCSDRLIPRRGTGKQSGLAAIIQVAGGSSGPAWPLTFLSRLHHTLWTSVFPGQMALEAWHLPPPPHLSPELKKGPPGLARGSGSQAPFC